MENEPEKEKEQIFLSLPVLFKCLYNWASLSCSTICLNHQAHSLSVEAV